MKRKRGGPRVWPTRAALCPPIVECSNHQLLSLVVQNFHGSMGSFFLLNSSHSGEKTKRSGSSNLSLCSALRHEEFFWSVSSVIFFLRVKLERAALRVLAVGVKGEIKSVEGLNSQMSTLDTGLGTISRGRNLNVLSIRISGEQNFVKRKSNRVRF